jgi:hypothetical protein
MNNDESDWRANLLTSIGKVQETSKLSRLEKQFVAFLAERLRANKIPYQLGSANLLIFTFRTDVLGKCGQSECRAGIFAKTVIFMVKTGIPSPYPDCSKCTNGYVSAVNALYGRTKDRFMGRVWFHGGAMVYEMVYLCGRIDAVDRFLVRDLLNTAVNGVRRFLEELEESGYLEHYKEVHLKHDCRQDQTSMVMPADLFLS